jgi:hypothetical protein
VILAGLALIALWLWMARATTQGRNWARILSTVLFGRATLELLSALAALAFNLGISAAANQIPANRISRNPTSAMITPVCGAKPSARFMRGMFPRRHTARQQTSMAGSTRGGSRRPGYLRV